MNKYEAKQQLLQGKTLQELFTFIDGQECLIYKGNFEKSDNIIYIPDTDLNEIPIDRELEAEEIDYVVGQFYSGFNFIDKCNGNEKLAKALFDFCDWQHPCVQDIKELYFNDEEEFFKEFGICMYEC
jgi:hypothetical protein